MPADMDLGATIAFGPAIGAEVFSMAAACCARPSKRMRLGGNGGTYQPRARRGCRNHPRTMF